MCTLLRTVHRSVDKRVCLLLFFVAFLGGGGGGVVVGYFMLLFCFFLFFFLFFLGGGLFSHFLVLVIRPSATVPTSEPGALHLRTFWQLAMKSLAHFLAISIAIRSN